MSSSAIAVPTRADGISNKPARKKKKSESGGSGGQKWCTVHRTTKYNGAECYNQGVARSQTSGTHNEAVVGIQARPEDTKKRPGGILDDEFNKDCTFLRNMGRILQ